MSVNRHACIFMTQLQYLRARNPRIFAPYRSTRSAGRPAVVWESRSGPGSGCRVAATRGRRRSRWRPSRRSRRWPGWRSWRWPGRRSHRGRPGWWSWTRESWTRFVVVVAALGRLRGQVRVGSGPEAGRQIATRRRPRQGHAQQRQL